MIMTMSKWAGVLFNKTEYLRLGTAAPGIRPSQQARLCEDGRKQQVEDAQASVLSVPGRRLRVKMTWARCKVKAFEPSTSALCQLCQVPTCLSGWIQLQAQPFEPTGTNRGGVLAHPKSFQQGNGKRGRGVRSVFIFLISSRLISSFLQTKHLKTFFLKMPWVT